MNWKTLKDSIYFFDGFWLDIYVLNTTQEHWNKWVNTVNNKYTVDFYNGQTEKTEPKIDFQSVLDFWTGKTHLLNGATVKLGNIDVK